MVNRFAEEVVSANGAGDVVAGAVVLLLLAIFLRELDGDLELGQHVAFNVESNLRRVRRRVRIAHESAKMIGAEVDLISKCELSRGDTELVGLGGVLEDLVAA